MSISLTIIKSKRKLSSRIFLYIFFCSVILLFSATMFTDSKPLYLIFGVISFVSGIIITYAKEYIINGTMILNENQIEVTTNLNEKEIFKIKAIKRIDFTYEEFEGESYNSINALGYRKGLHNYFTFYLTEEASKSFEVLLKKTDLLMIHKLIMLLKNTGVKVKVNKKWKKLVLKNFL